MFSNELICNILSFIIKNINRNINIDELSNTFLYNRTYIMKLFKKEIGISIIDFINSIRIYNSLKYYYEDNYILSIALKNGFNSLEYYSEMFKKIIGVSPIIYKKYISHNINIKDNDIDSIITNINKIKNLNDKYLKYLSNRKPTKPMSKTISLFNSF